jgi:protein-tyrosine-phosphatase
MAEAILKHLVADRPDASTWQIASAGTWARRGAPPALLSQLVTQGIGVNISSHLSQPVTAELIQRFNLILTMEHQQKEGLKLHFPDHADRIYLLSEMVGRIEDVPDPILGELVDYQAAAKLMEHFLSDGLEKIYQLASRNGPDDAI